MAKASRRLVRELGIADSTLHHWCKVQSEQGEQAFVGSGDQTPLEEEVLRLKRELDSMRQERDLLKKLWASSRGNPDCKFANYDGENLIIMLLSKQAS